MITKHCGCGASFQAENLEAVLDAVKEHLRTCDGIERVEKIYNRPYYPNIFRPQYPIDQPKKDRENIWRKTKTPRRKHRCEFCRKLFECYNQHCTKIDGQTCEQCYARLLVQLVMKPSMGKKIKKWKPRKPLTVKEQILDKIEDHLEFVDLKDYELEWWLSLNDYRNLLERL